MSTEKNTSDNIDSTEITNEEFTETVTITAKKHLPVNGILIPYSIALILSTLLGVILGHIHPVTAGIPSSSFWKYGYVILGFLFIFIGAQLYVKAGSEACIRENILRGKLVTTGVYAWCRHPMYSGMLFISTGALFISGNAFMYVIPIIFFLVLQVVLPRTEEALLIAAYKEDYLEYKSNVRCLMPFPPKKA